MPHSAQSRADLRVATVEPYAAGPVAAFVLASRRVHDAPWLGSGLPVHITGHGVRSRGALSKNHVSNAVRPMGCANLLGGRATLPARGCVGWQHVAGRRTGQRGWWGWASRKRRPAASRAARGHFTRASRPLVSALVTR